MAVKSGSAVDVSIPGATVVQLNGMRWSADLTAEVVDTTAGWDAASQWRDYQAGWCDGTVTIEAKVDDTTPLILPGQKITAAVLTMHATRTLTVDMVITGVSPSAERYGDVLVTWTAQVAGSTLPVFAP